MAPLFILWFLVLEPTPFVIAPSPPPPSGSKQRQLPKRSLIHKPFLDRIYDPSALLPLILPLYMLHQFEEHGIDIDGVRFSFQRYACATFFGLGEEPDTLATCPVTPGYIFCVNVLGCWLGFLLAVAFRRRHQVVAACCWGVPMINAVLHVRSALSEGGRYNPGLVTGVVIFIPAVTWVLWVCLQPLASGQSAAHDGGESQARGPASSENNGRGRPRGGSPRGRERILTPRQVLTHVAGSGVVVHVILVAVLFLFMT